MTDDPRYPNAFDAAYGAGVPLSAVKANEGIAMNHYLTTGYATSSAQPDKIRAAGLGVILTYEEGAGELVGATRAQGQNIGRKILTALQAIPGLPLDGTLAVYVSVDVAVYGNYGACDQAFLGVRDVLHGKVQTRAYAEGAVIDHLAAAHITEGKGWLSASTGYPGWNAADSNVCLVQRVGSPVGSTDLNDITDVRALGAWWPPNSPYGDDVSAADVWGFPIKNPATGSSMTAAQRLIEAETNVAALVAQVKALQATVAQLQAASGAPAHYVGSVSVKLDPQ